MSRDAVFTRIYQRNLWSASQSRSGAGSSVESTNAIRRQLRPLLNDLGATSLLDIPCGDFNWMKEVDLKGITYTGADIVAELVAHNQKLFGRGDRSFTRLDLVQDQLPAVDVILCRDCLIHLSNREVCAALRNISKSRSRYILMTTFEYAGPNGDVVTGSWRRLNLKAHPFCFPEPLQSIEDGSNERGQKELALWRVCDIPTVAFGADN